MCLLICFEIHSKRQRSWKVRDRQLRNKTSEVWKILFYILEHVVLTSQVMSLVQNAFCELSVVKLASRNDIVQVPYGFRK